MSEISIWVSFRLIEGAIAHAIDSENKEACPRMADVDSLEADDVVLRPFHHQIVLARVARLSFGQRKESSLNKGMTISDVLSYKSEELRRSLGLDLPHPTSQGDLGEDSWISFLESFLPSRYAVSKGFVFDSRRETSEQIDIIIFDRHHSPLILETPNGECYVTAESVYAVFEVKQEINEGNIRYALDKINSVRDLHRTSREMIASGKSVGPRKLTRIIGGLLTKDSISEESVRRHLETYDGVDIVCAASDMTAFKRSSGEIEISNEQEALPAFFYLLLDELHKLGTVAAIDIREYARLALKSFHLEGNHHVAE